MSIPRDPGHSDALNLGIGVSKLAAGSTFGLDVIYEPIRTSTWAEAAGPTATASGAVIPDGGKTIENDFRFSNAMVRIGVGQELKGADSTTIAGFQFGLALRSIHYRLRQVDNVAMSTRHLNERWTEWMPTWGTSFRLPHLEIRYRGRLTTGTGRPGVAQSNSFREFDSVSASSIVAAPSGPLTLDEVRVVTHQFSVSFPIR